MEKCDKKPNFVAEEEAEFLYQQNDLKETKEIILNTDEQFLDNLFRDKEIKTINPRTIDPDDLNTLFDMYPRIYNRSTGTRKCTTIQKFLIINMHIYWEKNIKNK